MDISRNLEVQLTGRMRLRLNLSRRSFLSCVALCMSNTHDKLNMYANACLSVSFAFILSTLKRGKRNDKRLT